MPDRSAVELRLSAPVRIVLAIAGLLLLGILAVLVAVLVSLESTRTEIQVTRGVVTAAENRVQTLSDGPSPLLEATAPLAGAGAQADVRRALRRAAGAIGIIPGLSEDVTRGVSAAAGLAGEVQAAGLVETLATARRLADVATPAVQDLGARASALLASLDATGGSIRECSQRLRTLAPSQPGQVACVLRFVPNLRALVRRVRTVLDSSLSTQRGTRRLTRSTLARLEESLGVQREILVHVRSLDQKTGGPAPTAPLAP